MERTGDWVLTNGGPQWDWSLKGGHAVAHRDAGETNMAAILGAETQFGRQPRNRVFISSDQGAPPGRRLNGGKLPTALNSMYEIEQAGEHLSPPAMPGFSARQTRAKTWELIQPLDAGVVTFIRLTASEPDFSP
ncbi:MAG: hypothetical protein IPK21_21580 [Haliscomenobacter sp.]|nr:hypothetical protein [Haliscomenobacter sp.]